MSPTGAQSRRLIGINIAILVALIIVLRLEGRRWWCACGQAVIWISDPNSSHCSQHIADPYFLTHVLHGVAFCGIFAMLFPRLAPAWSFIWAMAVEAAWEILENSKFVIDRYRNQTAALGYEGDSIANSLGDLAACALGWWLAKRLGWKWSIALWVCLELILLAWIRDNLLLNIVMLLWPSEALKQWQLQL